MRNIALVFFLAVLSWQGLPTQAGDLHLDPHWSYEEQAQWGLLQDPIYAPPYPYAECGVGQKQSPVNLDSAEVVDIPTMDELLPKYREIPLSLTNNGHTLRANVSRGALFIGKNEYELAQFHFHAPSEHLLNGVRFPLEIHFVHGTNDGKLAVIGVFMEAGKYNSEFQKILDYAPQRSGETSNQTLLIRPDRLLPKHTGHFFTYAGSLTTPPCNEGIQWFILRENVQISAAQIEEFKGKFYRDNSRQEQKLNGRKLDVH